MARMNVIFKLVTSHILMSLLFLSNFRFYRQLRTLVMGPDGIDMIFKLAFFDGPHDVTNLNQSIWV